MTHDAARLVEEGQALHENPTATTREIPRDGADSIRDTQAVCVAYSGCFFGLVKKLTENARWGFMSRMR
jgi:hypothetical protein